MSDRALVIGLDAYDNPAWELRAAVRDALAFAKWVTAPGAGRATAETLTLLLSPHPDRPVEGFEFQQATEKAIQKALFEHKSNGADAQRFWFFYAGHGIAPAGGGPDEAPVVVPADVKDLDLYRSYPIDLGSWIREMQIHAPEYQVYFVDACRGIVVNEDAVSAARTLFFDLSKVKPESQARQAVLFATTAGQLANEQGLHGLFGGALMDGLHGVGPELEADPGTQEFVLTFGGLAAYTKRRIQLQSDEARRANRTLPTQEPAESLFRTQGSLELARFDTRPRSPVKVFVVPEEATAVGTAGILGYDAFDDEWARKFEKPSPLEVPLVWNLPSTVYKIEIEANGFENWWKKVEVFGPMELHAELVPKPSEVPAGQSDQIGDPGAHAPGGPPSDFGTRGALESIDLFRSADAPVRPPAGAELARGTEGDLEVRTRDRYARIEVFDAEGKLVGATWQHLARTLPVGSYRVRIALPTEPPTVRLVLVTADEPEVIEVQPDPQLTERLPASAGIIYPKDGMSEPSETFGTSTTTHLGSLLAWAAWAAQFNPEGDGRRLRALGVEPVPASPGACFVRVLVGDALAPGPTPQGGPIEALSLSVNQQVMVMKPVPALAGLAVQCQAPLPFHTSLTVETDGLGPKRIPLPFIADHVWTIVIVREPTQRTEIHRYLQRTQTQEPFDDTIRLVEQNWRALETRSPPDPDEFERLILRNLDPLSLAVLGYRLALADRRLDLEAVVALMKPFQLTDAYVLKAFLGDREEKMRMALTLPAPVVGEGYHWMETWLIEHFAKQDMPPPIAPEPFVGGLWTTFDASGRAVISQAFPVHDAPAWATPLVAAAEATARVELPAAGERQAIMGTGFLIGPRALALTDFVARENPTVAVFDGAQQVAIEGIVGATSDDRHGALARIAPVERTPLKLRWALPVVGTRIAVIGHPQITFSPTVVTLAAFTTYPSGEKMIMPGVIVAVEETRLTYECWTMAGVAGGPIVDIETGEVIGIHHSGRYESGAKKLGFGVPVTAIEALLRVDVG